MLLVEDRLEAAKAHLAAGRMDSAAFLFESVLDLSPANVAALSDLASIRLRTGDVKRAHTLAAQAAGRAANDPNVLSLLAKTALAAEREDQATAALDQALAIDPFHVQACRLKAGLLVQEANPREAEQLLQNALEKHPSDPDLLAALSEIYRLHGITAPAIELGRKALALDPGRPELLSQLGAQFAQIGDNSNAAGLFERAHLLEPGNALFMVQLADAQAALGELSAALQTARRTINLFPDLLPAWASYVRVMIYRGEAQAGLAEFVSAAKRHPDKVTALFTLAASYRIAGDPGQALRLVEPLVRQLQTLKPHQRLYLMSVVRDCCLSLGLFDQIAATFAGFDARAALGLPPAPVLELPPEPAEPTASGNPEPAPASSVEPLSTPELKPSAEIAEAGSPKVDAELIAALGEASFAIDAGLSTLETMVLLRFRPGARNASPLDIYGPAHLAPAVTLLENVRFTPTDVPTAADLSTAKRTFPLSHILALPAVARGKIADALPYIHASEERRAIWRRSLAGLPRPLVAIAWDASRPGLLLEDYRPVLEGFAGTLVSVIWDESRHQLASWRSIIDAGVHFNSLADLAAVIAETDAIIGPDGIPLHVAGAMGKRGAVLSVPSAPWYWFGDGETSVWYPSISVFRTQAFGNWQEKLPELGEKIASFLGGLGQVGDVSPVEDPPLSESQHPGGTN